MTKFELERLSNADQAPRAEVNVELAHTYWDCVDFIDRFSVELKKSTELFRELRVAEPGRRVSTSILVDDKRLSSNGKLPWLYSQIAKAPELFSSIDYVVLESELKGRLLSFYNTIRPEKVSSIKAEIERYIRSKRITACSHDIAIWHVMRSGALGYRNLPVYRIGGELKSERLVPSFCAPRIVSILNQGDREHEEDAETEILKFVEAPRFDWRSIERAYYY